MLEDTDVVFEGHELHRYLQEQGYSDYEVVSTRKKSSGKVIQHVLRKIVTAIKTKLQMIIPGCQTTKRKVFAFLQLEVEKILESGLLLEADYDCISCFLEPTSLTKDRPIWGNVSLLYGIGMCAVMRAWRKDLVPWFIPPMCTCVAAEHFVSTWYVHRQKKMFTGAVHSLLHVFKEISSHTRRVIVLIQENELLLRGFTLSRSRTAVMDDLKSVKPNWYLMIGLRKGIAQVLQGVIGLLISATQNLVREFPLKGQLDHEHNYAAFLLPEELGIAASDDDDVNKFTLGYLKRLQAAYVLLQSEFLRRYALCSMTSLWSNEFQSLVPLFEIANKLSQTFCTFAESLRVDYKFYSCYGKESSAKQQPVSSVSSVSNPYVGLHSAKLYMQGMLHKVMQLEEMLEHNQKESNTEPDRMNKIVTELNDITQEITSCTNCIEIALSCCKSLDVSSETAVETTTPLLPLDCARVQENDPIPVGYSDFDPQVEDEVFEALVNRTVDNDDDNDFFDFKIENDKKQQKECSKIMLCELKSVLVHKAEEMKERENRALRNKGIFITEDSSGCEADVSKNDTLSVVADSSISEVSDFLNSEINSPSCDENVHIKCEPSDKSWSITGLPFKPLGKTLVGQEETFGDSGESDMDETDSIN